MVLRLHLRQRYKANIEIWLRIIIMVIKYKVSPYGIKLSINIMFKNFV
jgi:hypothetical protein